MRKELLSTAMIYNSGGTRLARDGDGNDDGKGSGSHMVKVKALQVEEIYAG